MFAADIFSSNGEDEELINRPLGPSLRSSGSKVRQVR